MTNLAEMDDFENLFMSKMVIFQDSTGANEGAKASKACFGFSTQLSMFTPHHRAKLVTWIEGDIYGFLQLVTIEVRHTGRTLFNNCHFEHTSGSGKIAREGRKGARKQIKCYNCQKMGSHIAADYPHPKALRQGASAATELKEGETTLSDFLQHLPPTKNNQRANMMREFDEPLELAACEPTTQDSFDEPLHAAQFR